MALQTYITFSDITNRHIKLFPEAEIQPYIDEANNELEDVGLNLGLDSTDLVFPISQLAKRYLLHYVTMRFANDSIGMNETDSPESDMYRQLMKISDERLDELKPKLTYWILSGEAENDVSLRSTSWGKRVRTA